MLRFLTLLIILVGCAGAQTRVNYATQIQGGPLRSDYGPLASTLPTICGVGGAPLSIVRNWSAQPTETLVCDLYPGSGLIQPASGKTILIVGTISGPPTQLFDLSAGGAVVITGPAAIAYPQWVGVKGDNSTDNHTTLGYANTLACASKLSLYFPVGTYLTSTSITVSCGNAAWIGEYRYGTIIQHTGTGAVTSLVNFSGVLNPLISNITILGDSHVVNALAATNTHRGAFRDITLGNVTGACFLTNFFVGNSIDDVACSNVELGGFSTIPTNGLVLDGIATADVVTNFRADGVSNADVYLGNSGTLTFNGGLWEGAKYGMYATNQSLDVVINTMDVECNNGGGSGSHNLYILGARFNINGGLSGDGGNLACDTGADAIILGENDVLTGGQYAGLTIDVSAIGTQLMGVSVQPQASGSNKFTDNSTTTTRKGMSDIGASGALFPDYQPNNLNIGTTTDTGAKLHVDSGVIQVTGNSASPTSGKGPYISFDGSNGGISCYDFAMAAFCSMGMNMPVFGNVPTSAGTGGLYLCIDISGTVYKKSSCP